MQNDTEIIYVALGDNVRDNISNPAVDEVYLCKIGMTYIFE